MWDLNLWLPVRPFHCTGQMSRIPLNVFGLLVKKGTGTFVDISRLRPVYLPHCRPGCDRQWEAGSGCCTDHLLSVYHTATLCLRLNASHSFQVSISSYRPGAGSLSGHGVYFISSFVHSFFLYELKLFTGLHRLDCWPHGRTDPRKAVGERLEVRRA